MDKVDFVLVGSEAVVESGGLVNAVGSNQIAIIARAANKPFYALAERYFYISEILSMESLTQGSASATNSTACFRYHSTISLVTIQKFFHFPDLSWLTDSLRTNLLPQTNRQLPPPTNRISSLQE